MDRYKILLDESEMPKACTTSRPICQSRCRRSCTQRRKNDRPARPRRPVPMELILQEVSQERYIDIPALSRRSINSGDHRPSFGVPAGKGARYTGTDLLQIRGRLAGRLAQAEYGGGPGLLQQDRRDETSFDRDGAGQWGARSPLRATVRHRMQSVYGQGVL